MVALRWFLLLVLVLVCPCIAVAQPIPPGGGTGTITFPVTTCVNQVAVGMNSSGVLQCSPVTPVMAPGLAPTGVDINPLGQVTATHLAAPLPLTQGGLGITSGIPGGLPYFITAGSLASSNTLAQDAPVFGGGSGQPPQTGTRSGTTTQVATVLGALTTGKQLQFDANGNVVASTADIGGGGPGTVPGNTCVDQVAIGISSGGVLACSPVLPAMAPSLVAAGGDVTAAGSVLVTHLSAPLPIAQGGLGITSGSTGGLLYFAGPTTLTSSPTLALNTPLFGGGAGQAPVTGSRSGTTLHVGTVSGALVPNKQVTFDANGNLIASTFDVGATDAGPGGAVSSVFGRTGAVTAQSGDYTVNLITNAADLTAPNTFTHPSGQTMRLLTLQGQISGTLTLRAPTLAGGSLLTFPAGSIDFTTTGGPGMVVRQGSSGGPFTVGTLNFSDLAGAATPAQVPLLQDHFGVLPVAKGGMGWTDTTVSGITHRLATVGTPFVAGECVTASPQLDLITTGSACGGTTGTSGTILPGTSGNLVVYANTGSTIGDSGIAAAQVVTSPSGLTVGRLVLATGSPRQIGDSTLTVANICQVGNACSGYQASLGFTAENVANKSTTPTLGTSDVLYPTQNAVRQYVDSAVAGLSTLFTWGPGLSSSGTTIQTASTEANFLTNGGATGLACGIGQQGKMQVMTNGDLQYCDGATTAVLRAGTPTQSGLAWLVTPSGCTTDANGGKLTVNGTNQIVCASDIGGGSGGGGGVASVFGRTGVIVASPGDYQAAQVTGAADVAVANVFTHASGQSMRRLVLPGDTSGAVTLRAPDVAGTQTLTLPLDSSLPGFLHPSTTTLTCGPGTAGAVQVLNNGVLQYCDNSSTPALRAGFPLFPLGPLGTLQATDAANRLAAYAGTSCNDPNAVMQGMTSAGSAVCTLLPDLTGSARVLLTTPDAHFPTGVNLGGLASGIVRSAVSGGLAAITTVPAPAGDLVGTTAGQTLDNKRVNRRPVSLPTTTTPLVIDSDAVDMAIISELNQDTQFANPTGVATPGQWLLIQAHSTVPRLVTWDTHWSPDVGLELPTTTSGGALYDLWLFSHNASTSKWMLMSNSQLMAATGVVPGTYTCPSITVNARGQLTAAANGSCGPGGGAAVAGVTHDVQFNLNGTQLGADSRDFAYDPATGALALARLQLGQSGSYYLFRDSLGHKNRLIAPSVTPTPVAWYLPPEGGDICTTKSTGCGSGSGVSIAGTPTAGQVAEWTNATTLQGVNTTGSGSYVKSPAAAPTGPLVGTTDTQTLSGKRLTPRVTTLSSAATNPSFACDFASGEQCEITATGASSTLTVSAPTGTMQNGELRLMLFLCTNAMPLAFDPIFIASPNVPIPSTCPAGTSSWFSVGTRYSATLNKFQIIASN